MSKPIDQIAQDIRDAVSLVDNSAVASTIVDILTPIFGADIAERGMNPIELVTDVAARLADGLSTVVEDVEEQTAIDLERAKFPKP